MFIAHIIHNWLYLLFYNVKVYEAISYDIQYISNFFAIQQRLNKQTFYYLFRFLIFLIRLITTCAAEFFFEIQIVFLYINFCSFKNHISLFNFLNSKGMGI